MVLSQGPEGICPSNHPKQSTAVPSTSAQRVRNISRLGRVLLYQKRFGSGQVDEPLPGPSEGVRTHVRSDAIPGSREENGEKLFASRSFCVGFS